MYLSEDAVGNLLREARKVSAWGQPPARHGAPPLPAGSLMFSELPLVEPSVAARLQHAEVLQAEGRV